MRAIFFEPTGSILSSHRYVFENPPDEYRFVMKNQELDGTIHRYLNSSGYKYGLASLPWHIVQPLVRKYARNIPNHDLTFAWNHIVFRNEPWVIHVEWGEMLAGFSMLCFKLFRRTIERALMSDNCKRIITWSSVAKESLINNYPNSDQFDHKITIVPLAVPSKPLIKREYSSKKVRFLFVCSLMSGREDYNFHMKGGKETLLAFEKIRCTNPDVELVMISDMPDFYKKLADNIGNVTIIDHRISVESVAELYKNCDIFLFPGHDTPFGVILEAMSYGLPVIATDVYGNCELVSDNETGFLIPPSRFVRYFSGTIATRPMTGPKHIPNDIRFVDACVVANLADKMSILMQNVDLRKQMSQSAIDVTNVGSHSITHRNVELKRIFDRALEM